MSKQKDSKLTPFTERLDHWFGTERQTLKYVQEQLKQDGCEVSIGWLGEWWEQRQSQLAEQSKLNLIAQAAGSVQRFRSSFAENPPPDLDDLVSLFRLNVFQLASTPHMDPRQMELCSTSLRTVMEYFSGKTKAAQKERELTLAEGKFAWLKADELEKALVALHGELKELTGGDAIYQRFEQDIRAARERAKK